MSGVHIKYVNEWYRDNVNYSDNGNFGIIETLVGYIFRSNKTKIYLCDGRGVICDGVKEVALQFYYTQLLFNEPSLKKLSHLIISFKNESKINMFEILNIASAVADYIGKKFQLVFAVHIDTYNLHIHFLINTVSFLDGSVYRESTAAIKNYYNIIDYQYKKLFGRSVGECTYYLNKSVR